MMVYGYRSQQRRRLVWFLVFLAVTSRRRFTENSNHAAVVIPPNNHLPPEEEEEGRLSKSEYLHVIAAGVDSSSNSKDHHHSQPYWTDSHSVQRYGRDLLPVGTRITFRLHDTSEVPNVFDATCAKHPDRARDIPPLLMDTRAARRWEQEKGGSGSGSGSGSVSDSGRDGGDAGTGATSISSPPPREEEEGKILDFSTTVTTNLKILFLGDSVAQQFSDGFESVVDMTDVSSLAKEATAANETNEAVQRFYRAVLETTRQGITKSGVTCTSAAAPVRGGGTVAMWRVTELLSLAQRNKGSCNENEGGWTHKQLYQLLQHKYIKYTEPKMERDNNKAAADPEEKLTRIGSFDAVVIRIQHGWMRPPQITRARFLETLRLCGELLGAKTVIIMTINFTNNVIDGNTWKWASRTNAMVREIAETWTAEALSNGSGSSLNNNTMAQGGVTQVLVQEFANYTTQVIWANARSMGSNAYPDLPPPNPAVADWDQINDGTSPAKFLLDKTDGGKFPRTIPMVCANVTTTVDDVRKGGSCTHNAISRDGMHWCMQSVGPRYFASVACLLGCAHNRDGSENGDHHRGSSSSGAQSFLSSRSGDQNKGDDLRRCERVCNDQFMSLVPVKNSWIGRNTTIFSRA